MSNRIAVFNDGVIQQLAPPDALYERPENAFVAQFIGENNKLRGKVADIDGDFCVVQTAEGAAVYAMAVNVSQRGEKSTLSLRPERVVVNPEPGSVPNIFDAEVLELIYLGDHIRTRVALLGRDDFIIKVPNSADHAFLAEGEVVSVGWLQQDCRALDA